MGRNKRFDEAKALRLKDRDFAPIDKALCGIFAEMLYYPLFALLEEQGGIRLKENPAKKKAEHKAGLKNAIAPNERLNAKRRQRQAAEIDRGSLEAAIISGRIRYDRGYFLGRLSAAISRDIKALGGKWDYRLAAFKLPPESLPPHISIALGQAKINSDRLHESMKGTLDGMRSAVSAMGKDRDGGENSLTPLFREAIEAFERNFQSGIAGLAIAPELTPEMREELAREYSGNMELDIKNWAMESIRRLRQRVSDNAFKGMRAADLAKALQHDWGISRNKARFLARQETSLLMSKFREARYKSAGVSKYRWSSSGDARVRESHAALDGHIFTWDSPPIVDPATGRRGHPGEDYGCRCVAIPLIDDEAEELANSLENDADFEKKHPRDRLGKFIDKCKAAIRSLIGKAKSLFRKGKGKSKADYDISGTKTFAEYASKKDDPNITPEKVLDSLQDMEIAGTKYTAEEIRAKIKETDAAIRAIKQDTKEKYKTIIKPDGSKTYTPERIKKHNEILGELFGDIDIKKPKNGEKPVFIVLGGRGGSGKSQFEGEVYDKNKFLVLNSDLIKEMLPEYARWNAQEVHFESSYILDKAITKARTLGLNVVWDTTMSSLKGTEETVLKFKKDGYHIEAHYMYLPRQKSVQRGIERFINPSNGRYVPLDILLSMRQNEQNFDKIKEIADVWSFTDNDVEYGKPPKLIAKKGNLHFKEGGQKWIGKN